MQVHSMCQPGRPAPRLAAVPGRLPRPAGPPQQRVQRVALAGPVRVAAALGEDRVHLLAGPAADLAEARLLGQVQIDVLTAALVVRHRHRVGQPGLDQVRGRPPAIRGMLSTTPTYSRGGITRRAVMSAKKSAISRAARSRQSMPSRSARSSSGSSTSVTFCT